MITQARLAIRLQRFEVIAVIVATAVIGLSALIVRLRLDTVGVPTTCWDQWFGQGGQVVGECESLARTFLTINEDEAGKVMAAMAILPLFAGLFLGVPIVAREIEAGTAPTVWALVGARGRWLAGRLVPMLAILGLSLGFLAIASDVLWAGRNPWLPVPNMYDVGLHGPGVVAKGLAVFGLALLAGALIGRTLPAVLIGVVLCFVLFTGAQIVQSAWMQAESLKHVTASTENAEVLFPGGTYFSSGWIGPDGRLTYDAEEAAAWAPSGVDPNEWVYQTSLQMGVPGSAYPTWALLETVGFGLIGVVATALVFPLVAWRRPI
jgi:ABC-type transport system involved in multi-copper enzyme maturation permease subunit